MAKVRCPSCGKIEDVDLQGRFLATCDICEQKFIVYIVGQRVPENTDVIDKR
ncbi:MAG: hypothetical protein QM401_06710 [Bacillota bacterium]|nr:hypothetical protein [Bacillota bacterium]HHU60780.1 hypothetical protein [Natronincola sp.]